MCAELSTRPIMKRHHFMELFESCKQNALQEVELWRWTLNVFKFYLIGLVWFFFSFYSLKPEKYPPNCLTNLTTASGSKWNRIATICNRNLLKWPKQTSRKRRNSYACLRSSIGIENEYCGNYCRIFFESGWYFVHDFEHLCLIFKGIKRWKKITHCLRILWCHWKC